ncbi:MAG: hypothetical protein VCC01_12100, partial [Candidatus Hydrogenedentota bacterium]
RMVLNAEKVDVLANGMAVAPIHDLFDCADEIGCRLSLRTDASASPRDLAALKTAGLWDLLLCPTSLGDATLLEWLKSADRLEIPLRLELCFSTITSSDIDELVELADEYSVEQVTVVPGDIFSGGTSTRNIQEVVGKLGQIVPQLESLGTEIGIHGLPFCSVDEAVWPNLVNSRQRGLDHNHYIPTAWTLARSIYGHRVFMAEKTMRMVLGRHTLSKNPIDEILLPFVINRSYRYLLNRLVRRMTEHLNVARSVPKALERSKYDEVMQERQELDVQHIPAACESCRLRKICDHNSVNGQPLIPDFTAKPLDGDVVVSPLHLCREQAKYYDTIDADRAENQVPSEELAEAAMEILTQTQPTRTYTSADYKVIDSFSEQMEGGLKWWSVTNTEKLSTPLGTFTPPLTISVEVGAGIADYVGFSFGRHCKIVCPMEAYRHTLSLHVDTDGRYVLLRDGKAMAPVEFDGTHNLPLRLGERLEPQLSVWNIDDCILTQSLKVWNEAEDADAEEEVARYS